MFWPVRQQTAKTVVYSDVSAKRVVSHPQQRLFPCRRCMHAMQAVPLYNNGKRFEAETERAYETSD